VGYYYLATSSVLRQTLGPVAPSGNEQGFELYYNAAITGWFILTADIQAIDPAQFEARSTFLFGLIHEPADGVRLPPAPVGQPPPAAPDPAGRSPPAAPRGRGIAGRRRAPRR
jgi:hypothetical protein